MTQKPVPEPLVDLGGLSEAVAHVTRAFSQHMDIVSAPLRAVLADISRVADAAFRERERQLAPWREAVKRMMALHAEAEQVHDEVLDTLLARGWCHSYQFTDPDFIRIGKLARAGKGAEIDELMAEFTRRQADRILKTACEKFPARAAILTDAFEAHRTGKYTLSIPALLNQLDGIGCEVMGLGRHFFKAKNRTDALAGILDSFRWPGIDKPYTLRGIHGRMLSALERTWGMARDTNSREPGTEYSPLNRHGVLHGLDSDYPTEHNSLRCVLNIGFILEVQWVLHEDIPSQLRSLAELFEKRSG